LLILDKMRHAVSLLKETVSEWSSDRASRLAAALTFYTTFSIAPHSAQILLLGAEFIQVYARRFGSHRVPVEPNPIGRLRES